MKKFIYILILSSTFSFNSFAQNDYDNQWDLDIRLVGLEGSYKTRIGNKLFLGFGLGGGYLLKGNGNEGFVEVIKVKSLLDYQFTNSFHMYLAGAYSFATLASVDDGGKSIGIELGIFYRIWKIEVGFEPSLIFFKENFSNSYDSGVLTTSFLIIKIPLSRW